MIKPVNALTEDHQIEFAIFEWQRFARVTDSVRKEIQCDCNKSYLPRLLSAQTALMLKNKAVIRVRAINNTKNP
jgi:hypothetical protein